MSSADGVPSPLPVVVTRWQRYGYSRAYVRVEGEDVGYRDLKSGEVHCTRADLSMTVRQATAHLMPAAPMTDVSPTDYQPRHASSDDRASLDPEPLAIASVNAIADRDLAMNPPGAAARARAVELREQAPVRTAIARLIGVKTDERAWRIGADAELKVAEELTKLGPDWRVLHAITVGDKGSDIDHLIIGPGGIFTVNTKHHPDGNIWVGGDVFMVNGQRTHYIRNSRHEAKRAARLLTAGAGFDVEVHGLIAVVGATRGFTVVEQPRDHAVIVVGRRELVRHLEALPPVLGIPSINRIHEIARHTTTWRC